MTFDQVLRVDQSLWLVERAYCLVVSNNYFPCHSEILYCLLQCRKQWLLEVEDQKRRGQGLVESEEDLQKVGMASYLSLPAFIPVQHEILSDYAQYKDGPMSGFPYDKEVSIVAGHSQVNINYTFPPEPEHEDALDEMRYAEQI